MGDEMKRAFEDMKKDLGEMREDLRSLRDLHKQSAQATEKLTSRFELFLDRFQEASEIWVQHDTDQLQRVTAVENDNAALNERWRSLEGRVEALEKKAG